MSRILNFKINSISLSQFHIGSYRLFNFIDSKTFYYYYIWILDFGSNFFSRDLFYRIFYCDLYFRLDFKTIQNTMELEITIFTVTFSKLYQSKFQYIKYRYLFKSFNLYLLNIEF